MIDLEKFSNEIKTIVPVLDNKCVYHRKIYFTKGEISNGWYKVKIKNNYFMPIESICIEFSNLSFSTIKGYIYNNYFLPQNFDVFRRKITGSYETMVSLFFNKNDSFSSVEVIIWEDGKIFYYHPNYTDVFIYEVKKYIDENLDIKTLKGITPELKTLCLFHEIEKQKLAEDLKKVEIKKLARTIQGRLVIAFKRVGAELLQYSINGNRIIVDWKLNNQKFNSVINKNTFQVIESGYCMEGDDKKHSLHSMVVLANDYQKDELIYKTRE